MRIPKNYDGSKPITWNDRWEKFANAITSGKNALDSYKDVYGNQSNKGARTNAARLLHNRAVQSRIQFFQSKNSLNWSRDESMNILKTIAMNEENKAISRVKAIEVLNVMCGYDKLRDENKDEQKAAAYTFLSQEVGVGVKVELNVNKEN